MDQNDMSKQATRNAKITKEIKELDAEIKVLQESNNVQLVEAYERLQDNPDFKLLITEHYLTSEVVRINNLKATAAYRSGENSVNDLKALDSMLMAKSELFNWLNKVPDIRDTTLAKLEEAKIRRENYINLLNGGK